ncbi:MAG: cytochrome-c oxidase, cbb3-type subunit III [gamma proteobacterium endosymbiont of Lamellibrachia anaximandri]|nr:cytochrome-c oxidase, cbb3-type subunit III [gamma proteobacterium endosymbiont of Lamellibrachia anaximandri]MBL3533889.1 cytochrome-c oxidase, cbb3-type subunit III [gamma proteobacterium endosymbiont of Lamellibrachia anaximandri]
MADNNPFPGENNTGHIWDDNIRELANPPPRWWMIAFWASIAWFFGYGVLYPMYPIGQKPTEGVMGWTQIKEYQEGVDEVVAVRAELENQLKDMSAKDILANPGLADYTVASVKVLFGDNCAPCHGGGGQGGPGFPVLADDDWLFGGTVETIEQTITMGRKGIMTAHGKILSGAEADKLVDAIVAGDPMSDPNFLQKGCVACHGMDGKGMQMLGSANLTDGIYRFVPGEGESIKDSVKQTILHGVNDVTDPQTREAVMPSFGDRLSKDEIKKLAVYVYKFGGGQ